MTPTVHHFNNGYVERMKKNLQDTMSRNFKVDIIPNAYVLQDMTTGLIYTEDGVWSYDLSKAALVFDTPVNLMGTTAVPQSSAAGLIQGRIMREIEGLDFFLKKRSNYVHL